MNVHILLSPWQDIWSSCIFSKRLIASSSRVPARPSHSLTSLDMETGHIIVQLLVNDSLFLSRAVIIALGPFLGWKKQTSGKNVPAAFRDAISGWFWAQIRLCLERGDPHLGDTCLMMWRSFFDVSSKVSLEDVATFGILAVQLAANANLKVCV